MCAAVRRYPGVAEGVSAYDTKYYSNNIYLQNSPPPVHKPDYKMDARAGVDSENGEDGMSDDFDGGGFEWWRDEEGYCWHFAWETPLWFWLDGITVPRNTTPPVSGKA